MKNKIKAILFDLDGVIIDAKNIHFESLNSSLEKKYKISPEEHLNQYDGLKTHQKLDLLTRNKGLPEIQHKKIWERKQYLTNESLNSLKKDSKIYELMKRLKSDGYLLGVCSNSISSTVNKVLEAYKINDFMDVILSNQDVKSSKPHPEIYWSAMSKLELLPEDCLIVEDSPYGLLSAHRANVSTHRVTSANDLNYQSLIGKISELDGDNMKNKIPKWEDENLNVLIPMAGAGSRFSQAGYTFPKPLIEVQGKPMIQLVTENLNIKANYIFVVQKKHREAYKLDSLLNLLSSNCKIVETDGMTEGAACTALLAEEYIDNESPLFFANSDQYVDWNSNEFFYKMNETSCDGGIVTFKATHPKWSFAKIGSNGNVEKVAEKDPISDDATVGFYYWKHGKDFVNYAKEMISKDIRTNNEFYVCPVFNQAIEAGKKIVPYEIKKMWGIGTPEDLSNFLRDKNS